MVSRRSVGRHNGQLECWLSRRSIEYRFQERLARCTACVWAGCDAPHLVAHTCADVHTCVHMYIHMYGHMHIHAYTHAYAHVRNAHMHIHMYGTTKDCDAVAALKSLKPHTLVQITHKVLT